MKLIFVCWWTSTAEFQKCQNDDCDFDPEIRAKVRRLQISICRKSGNYQRRVKMFGVVRSAPGRLLSYVSGKIDFDL